MKLDIQWESKQEVAWEYYEKEQLKSIASCNKDLNPLDKKTLGNYWVLQHFPRKKMHKKESKEIIGFDCSMEVW